MLKQRIITGVLLIALFTVAVFFLPNAYFALLAAIMLCVAAWEWSQFVGWKRPLWRSLYVLVTVAVMVLSASISPMWALLIGLLAWAWGVVELLLYHFNVSALLFQLKTARFLWGFLLLVPAWVAIVVLEQNAGPGWVLLLFAMVWASDIGGYFIGRQWGQALLTRVSPKKTWVGFWGGLFAAIFVAGIGSLFLVDTHSGRVWLLILGLLTGVAAALGDLVISVFKRLLDIKDSGQILPGHGGMLDRLDSLCAASVVFTLFALL